MSEECIEIMRHNESFRDKVEIRLYVLVLHFPYIYRKIIFPS